jgi:hypothetical protein
MPPATIPFLSTMNELSVAAAAQILEPYSCRESKLPTSTAEREELKSALLRVAADSDYQILGICADNYPEGKAALDAYRQALGYTEELAIPTVDVTGAIYLKFNPRSPRLHIDRYEGTHRGVLVSCQSATEDRFDRTVGHLPLDLFN